MQHCDLCREAEVRMLKSNLGLLACAPVLAGLALFLGVARPQLQGQAVESGRSNRREQPVSGWLGLRGAQLVAAGGQALPGGLGQGLPRDWGKFNPLAPKEPMVADPNHAFPRQPSLPGTPFRPVSYGGDPLIAQLAHSPDGIVRLPPGDYSIPIRFY
jgi:hypothetical protein